ncbi:MAG: HD-GYP domain-containing protein [Dehalococcoidia bacterium]
MVARTEETAVSDAGGPVANDTVVSLNGRRNGGGHKLERHTLSDGGAGITISSRQDLQELERLSSYLKGLFSRVLALGIVGLLLGLTLTNMSVQRAVPDLAAYPVQLGFLLAFLALGWSLLRQAQANTVRLWRKTWQSFELLLAEAEALASHDSLTQLHNRRSFYRELQEKMDKARSSKTSMAILILDMDDLKMINDEYGHQAGDTALAHIASVLNEVARPQDTTARLGGDEFAIIMPQTDHRRAEEIATQVWRRLDEKPLILPNGASISVGVAIGVAGFPWSGDNMESIIHRADAGLYANKLARKSSSNELLTRERRHIAAAVVEVLSSALDIRDKVTHSHSRRVARMAAAVARHMGLDDDNGRTSKHAAALHEIGKIGVPDSVLLKPSSLKEEEWRDMRRHSELGYYILKGIDIFEDTADIVYSHHERYDGQGYPRGLEGKRIPLGARVFAVVDSYDAMTSSRPYRKPRSQRKALQELRRHAGSQFDPDVLEAFFRVLPDLATDEPAVPFQ